jgi:iron-sulfur cluster repair protein YtfE (RIC family)
LDRKEHRACPHGLADGPDESWQSLYAGCAKLYEDLCEHTRIENEELFPLFE